MDEPLLANNCESGERIDDGLCLVSLRAVCMFLYATVVENFVNGGISISRGAMVSPRSRLLRGKNNIKCKEVQKRTGAYKVSRCFKPSS